MTGRKRKKLISSEAVESVPIKPTKNTNWKDCCTCLICHKNFVNRFTLKKHFEDIHNKTERLLCDLCLKVCFSKDKMRYHMKMFHIYKHFACNVCEYKTASGHLFRMHKMTHAASIECTICLKQVSALKVHMITHKPKVSCPICQKLVKKRQLQTHSNIFHKKIKCKDCDKVLDNKEDLRKFVVFKVS